MTPVVALHSVLREGHEGQYDQDHQTIFDDLVPVFLRAGIEDWRIWRSGRDLFHLVACNDFVTAMRTLEADPINVRWSQFIGRHGLHFVPADSDYSAWPLAFVYSFAEQAQQESDKK